MHHNIVSASNPFDPAIDLNWLAFTDFRDSHVAVRPPINGTASRSGNTVTVNFSEVHNLRNDEEISVSGDLNETINVASIPDSTTATYTSVVSGTASGLSVFITPSARQVSSVSCAGSLNSVLAQSNLIDQPRIISNELVFYSFKDHFLEDASDYSGQDNIYFTMLIRATRDWDAAISSGVFGLGTSSNNYIGFRKDNVTPRTMDSAIVVGGVRTARLFNGASISNGDVALIELKYLSDGSFSHYKNLNLRDTANTGSNPLADIGNDWTASLGDSQFGWGNRSLQNKVLCWGVSSVDHSQNANFIGWINGKYKTSLPI